MNRSFYINIFLPFCANKSSKAQQLGEILLRKFEVEAFEDAEKRKILEKYFTEKVIPHKIEVQKAGLELVEKPWFREVLYLSDAAKSTEPIGQFKEQLFVHDLSKFSKNEAYGYAIHQFNNPEPTKAIFRGAWHHHKINNAHHPEHWLNVNRDGSTEPLPMPSTYIAEMIADWIGASRSYGGSFEEWVSKNLSQFLFHEYTATIVEKCLTNMGFKVENKGRGLVIL